MTKPTTTEPVLERIERRLTVAFCGLLHAQRNLDADPPTERETARAILLEVADWLELEAGLGLSNSRDLDTAERLVNHLREQAAEEGA